MKKALRSAGFLCLVWPSLLCAQVTRIVDYSGDGTLTFIAEPGISNAMVESAMSIRGPWTVRATVPTPGATNQVALTPTTNDTIVFRIRAENGIYSVNMFGVLRLTLWPGYNLLGNPFLKGSNTLEELFPPDCGLPENTFVMTFNPLAGSLGGMDPITPNFYPGICWDPPGPSLPPGKGFYMYLDPTSMTASNLVLTLTGDAAPMSRCSSTIIYGNHRYNLLSSPGFMGGKITTDLNLFPCDEDMIFQWPLTPPRHIIMTGQYVPDAGWIDPYEVVEPSIRIGEGFLLFRSDIRSGPWCSGIFEDPGPL